MSVGSGRTLPGPSVFKEGENGPGATMIPVAGVVVGLIKDAVEALYDRCVSKITVLSIIHDG